MLLDSNNLPIPSCNTGSGKHRIYVESEDDYSYHTKNKELYKYLLGSTCVVLILFFTLYSLNSAYGLMNMTNVMLLILIVATFFLLSDLFSKYLLSRTIVRQLEDDGKPCLTANDAGDTVIFS